MIDGTHCSINFSPTDSSLNHPGEDFMYPNYFSKKLKTSALNTQVFHS